ncbi:MAG: hypothetical protein INF91_10585 [Alphaproteobacteria bacterium]|nr:hypothetical protein [Alphaproteobacteria bacterium]
MRPLSRRIVEIMSMPGAGRLDTGGRAVPGAAVEFEHQQRQQMGGSPPDDVGRASRSVYSPMRWRDDAGR